jgi:hypothetical protein
MIDPRHEKAGIDQGVLRTPAGEDLEADRPIVLPKRFGLVGTNERALDVWGVVGHAAHTGFMVESAADEGNSYNGYFGMVLENLFLDGRQKANGADVGGAQWSRIRNVCVRRVLSCALHLRNQSHSVLIEGLDVEGTLAEDEPAVSLVGVKSITGMGGHLRLLPWGLNVEGHGVDWRGLKLERVGRMRWAGQGHEVRVADWQWPAEELLDLEGDEGGSRYVLTLRKTEHKELAVLGPDGKRHLVPKLDARTVVGNRPGTIEIRTRLGAWGKVKMEMERVA